MIPLRKVNEVPPTLKPGALEQAVEAFVHESNAFDVPFDPVGLYNQLIENMALVLIFKTPGSMQVWIAEDQGQVAAWAMTHVSKDVDNTLCFWMNDAWVAPRYRHSAHVKIWLETLTAEGSRLLCKHIIIPSSRGVGAYCRFLGKGWHPYVTLLKKDL